MNAITDSNPQSDLPPDLSAPAKRALAQAGIFRLEHLTRFSASELKQLHGIGPNALAKLHQSLAEAGLSFTIIEDKK